MEEQFFTKIEDEEEKNKKVEENKLENPFVTGLPNWDLEPQYDTIKRGNQE